MNAPAVGSFNERRSAPVASSEAVQREVIRVMREAGRSMTKSEIASCVRFTMLEVNIAIDRLQPDTISRGIAHGVIRYRLVDDEADAPPAKSPLVVRGVTAEPAQASAAPVAEQKPKCANTGIKSAVLRGLNEQAAPVSSADLAKALGLGLQQVKSALKTLKNEGLAKLDGHRHNARWSFRNQIVSQQASAPPAAVQPAVTTNTGTEGGVHSCAATSASAPRHGASSSLDALASGDALLQAHEAAAEQEAGRRNGAAAQLANDEAGGLVTEDFAEAAAAIQISDAKFALWSDGRLQIDAGDQFVEFTKAATRQLINYLGQICEIDPTSRV